ncbi:MAG: hypothetical protein AB8B61_03215, partial [Cyclobacteriaceae bacterium]
MEHTKDELINVIQSDKKGYYTGTRMILPFKCNILKLIVDGHIFTEFVGSEDIKIAQDQKNTSIYFRQIGKLKKFEGEYSLIKVIIAPLETDLTEKENHFKLICKILD